jgi:hypothetical protein
MNRPMKLVTTAAALAVAATVALAAPAQAAPVSYQQSSAMAEVVANEASMSPSEADPRGFVGVAKALAAGFKAASAPQAAGNVARLASVLGFAAEAPQGSPQVEAAYFDR